MSGFYLRMSNERAMFLPFVLFVSLIIFSVITTMITIYQNEKVISQQLWEQTKAETMVEMSVQKFKADHVYDKDDGTVQYHFPTGDVFITFTKKAEDTYDLTFDIVTDFNQEFIMNKRIVI